MRELQQLGGTGHFYECPRWHDGSWWVSDFHGHEVVRVEEDGSSTRVVEVAGRPGGTGWLPDGTMLIVSMTERRVLRLDDGALTVHADLGELFAGHANDMFVDGAGRAYVGNFGFDLDDPTAATVATCIAMVTPTGESTVAAGDLRFPNAIMPSVDGTELIVTETLASRHTAFAVAPDGSLGARRVYAQPVPPPVDPDAALATITYAPDGGCLDAHGRIWVADAISPLVRLVAEGGEIVEEIELPDGLHGFACGLGGADGRTLLIAAAPDFDPAARAAANESVMLTTVVDVPAAR